MAKPFRGKYHISLLLSLVENVFFVRFELYFRLVPRHAADSRMSISEEKACVRLCTAKITCTEKPHHPKKAFDEPTSESCVPKCYLFSFSPKLTMRHLSSLSQVYTDSNRKVNMVAFKRVLLCFFTFLILVSVSCCSVVEHCVSCVKVWGFDSQGTHVLTKHV